MKTRVLDSRAVLEWISGREPGRSIFRNLLEKAELRQARLFMSAINVGEVYDILRKRHTVALAESWRDRSRTLPVAVEVPTLEEIWESAALKSRFAISYADSFAAALAQKHNCPLVTGDPEFRRVNDLELGRIAP